jgi:hypothetical protein
VDTLRVYLNPTLGRFRASKQFFLPPRAVRIEDFGLLKNYFCGAAERGDQGERQARVFA